MTGDLKFARCVCGRVQCEATGGPIVSLVCYCTDCQAGGRQLEALAKGTEVLDPDGGTPYLTYRTDKFRCVKGNELLVGHKLRENAPTRRVVASCCSTAMFLRFEPGFWVSAYRKTFDEPRPPIEMRTKLERRDSPLPLPEDAPAYRGFPPRLFWRLIKARFAMLLGH